MSSIQRFIWFLLGMLPGFGDNLWRLINVTGIVVFVGPNGSGKSLAMIRAVEPILSGVRWQCTDTAHRHFDEWHSHVADCGCSGDDGCEVAAATWDACSRGLRLVWSTVPILGDDGADHPLYRPLTDYRELLQVEHADVLFDEVAGISDASDSASMPVQVVNWLHQLRKRDVRLRVTTPAYARCSKPIRQACQLVVDARAFFSEPAQSGRLWRPRRAMIYRAYDAFAFEDFTASKGQSLGSLARAAFWRPGSTTERRYDTLGQVLSLGHVTDTGMCVVCGGGRARPKCACSPEADLIPLDELEVHEHTTPSGSRVRSAQRRAE